MRYSWALPLCSPSLWPLSLCCLTAHYPGTHGKCGNRVPTDCLSQASSSTHSIDQLIEGGWTPRWFEPEPADSQFSMLNTTPRKHYPFCIFLILLSESHASLFIFYFIYLESFAFEIFFPEDVLKIQFRVRQLHVFPDRLPCDLLLLGSELMCLPINQPASQPLRRRKDRPGKHRYGQDLQ